MLTGRHQEKSTPGRMTKERIKAHPCIVGREDTLAVGCQIG